MNLTHLDTCRQHLDKMEHTWREFTSKYPDHCTTCHGGGCESCHGDGFCPFCMAKTRHKCNNCGWDEKTWVRVDRRPPNEVYDCMCLEDEEEEYN